MKIRWLAAYFETKVRNNGANGAWTKSEEKVKGLLQVEYLRVVFHYLCFSPRAVNLNKSYPAGSPPRCKIASASVSFGSKAMHKKLHEYKGVRRTFDRDSRPIHEHRRTNSLSMNVAWDWSQVAGECFHRQLTHTRGAQRVCETTLRMGENRQCSLWRMASN